MKNRTTLHMSVLQVRAANAPDSINGEERTFEITWSIGAVVRCGGYWSSAYDEELGLEPRDVVLMRIGGERVHLTAYHRTPDNACAQCLTGGAA